MVENFIWAFEQLNHEDIMGIYGGAHTEIDSDVEYSYFVPDPNMASQLNKKYPNTIHTKLLAKGYDDSTPWKTGSLEIGGKEYPSILWNEIWIKSTKTSYDSVLRVSFFRFAQLHLRLLSRNEEDEDSIRLATDRADYTNWFRLALIYDQPHTGAPFWNRRRSLRADCR